MAINDPHYIKLPDHLGGHEVTTVVPLDEHDKIIGWVDEYGTITDGTGKQIGDLIGLDDTEYNVVVMRKEPS